MPATSPEVAPAALTGADAVYYTVPTSAAKKALKLEIFLCNTHTAAVTVSLYVVPSGGSSAISNQIYADSISAKKSIPITVAVNLAAGGTLRGFVSTSGVVSMRVAPVLVDPNE